MTQFHYKNCVLILTKILLCHIIKLLEVILMNTYYFTVMINSDYRGFYIQAKTLSGALKSLESEIFHVYFYSPSLVAWCVCHTYSVTSRSGKRSHRSLRRDVGGIA